MKILWIILALLTVGLLVILAGAWSVFGEKLKAAQSVKKLEEGLYYLEYSGNYGFDAFLEKGGSFFRSRHGRVYYILPLRRFCERMIVTDTPAVTNHYLSAGEKQGLESPNPWHGMKNFWKCAAASPMQKRCVTPWRLFPVPALPGGALYTIWKQDPLISTGTGSLINLTILNWKPRAYTDFRRYRRQPLKGN